MRPFDEEEFLRNYRGSEKFLTEGKKYYAAFLELLQDEELLEKIRFANDVHKIPPLKSFILYKRDVCGLDLFCERIADAKIKQGLGACFGYLYKFLYGGYDSVQAWFDDDKTGIKTASYFVKRKGK